MANGMIATYATPAAFGNVGAGSSGTAHSVRAERQVAVTAYISAGPVSRSATCVKRKIDVVASAMPALSTSASASRSPDGPPTITAAPAVVATIAAIEIAR